MDFTNLKNYLDRMVNEYNTPGVDCIVYKNHQQLFRYYTGFCDIENNKPMVGNELYIIFSMTKMLTCTCALQLLEKGKYLLDDPVSKYLPQFGKMKITRDALDTAAAANIASGRSIGESLDTTEDGYAKNPITIRNLFTMSAGLDYSIGSPAIKRAIAENKCSTRDIVTAISETILGFEPGTRFRYSLCHDVLGALIEVWSGQSFGDYMKQHLLTPLGMSDTFFHFPTDADRLQRMMGLYEYDPNHRPKRKDLECPYEITSEYESGGAGLISCTEDYAVFLDALANGGVGKNGTRILSEASVKMMKTNHLTGQQSEDFEQLRKGYGYGLGVRTHINKARSGSLSPLGEFGWDGAAGCFSMVDTDNQLSLTYFQQIYGWDVRLQGELRNVLYSCLD